MAYEQRNNTGSLFKNDRKEKDTHPDITGSAIIDGIEYFVDGWHKEGKPGKKGFYSLSFKRKNKQGGQAPSRPKSDSGPVQRPTTSRPPTRPTTQPAQQSSDPDLTDCGEDISF